MEWQGWASLILVCGSLVTMIATRLAPHIVMMTVLAILSVCGILSPEEALSGFSNPGLIAVAGMFVIAAGIHASGGVDMIVNQLLGHPHRTRSALAKLFTPVLFMSGLINNTPVVATMIPGILAWSRRINIEPSKLLIPLSYFSILGGTLTLIGTSTNLIINGQYQSLTGNPGFSIFSITAIGLPVAIAGGVFMWAFFPTWLPDRKKKNVFANLREFTLEVTVDPNGVLVGKSVKKAGLRNLRRVFLVEIERKGNVITLVDPDEILEGGDRLVFAGDTEAISDLLRIKGIIPSTEDGENHLHLDDSVDRQLVEAVVSPHCAALGYAIRDARFRERYGAVVLAVARNGERVKGNLGTIELEAGDTLLLEARSTFVDRQRFNRDFLLINDLEQEAPRHKRALLAWTILGGVVLAMATGLLSMLNAVLAGAALMVITGCCSVNQAERSLDMSVILTIASAFALGVALVKTGVAGFITEGLISMSGENPLLILILTYVAVSLLTEFITNNAAAILMLPITLELIDKLGLHHEPFVFAIMMAASASFATPISYQTNLMVYGPGNYRYTDFIKVGVPMKLFVGLITLAILYLGWPLVI